MVLPAQVDLAQLTWDLSVVRLPPCESDCVAEDDRVQGVAPGEKAPRVRLARWSGQRVEPAVQIGDTRFHAIDRVSAAKQIRFSCSSIWPNSPHRMKVSVKRLLCSSLTFQVL